MAQACSCRLRDVAHIRARRKGVQEVHDAAAGDEVDGGDSALSEEAHDVVGYPDVSHRSLPHAPSHSQVLRSASSRPMLAVSPNSLCARSIEGT